MKTMVQATLHITARTKIKTAAFFIIAKQNSRTGSIYHTGLSRPLAEQSSIQISKMVIQIKKGDVGPWTPWCHLLAVLKVKWYFNKD